MEMRRKRRLASEINVVPYIDVMLVLLIIFMVTAPLLTQGVEVDLPEAAAEALEYEDRSEPLVLTVDASGQMYLNVGTDTEQPLDEEQVLKRAATVLRNKPETPVLVEGDRAVAYERVIRAMVLLQNAGARKVGFATDPEPRRASDR